jgi:hypothetical protein
MSELGNINKSYGKPINISVANTYSTTVLNSKALPTNMIIISSPINNDGNDIGTYCLIATDNNGTGVRLSYTIQPGNGLNVDSMNGDIIKLASGVFGYKMSDTSIGWPYMLTGWTSDAWYAVTCTLESNVVRLHQEVFGDSDYVASDEVKDMSSRIVSKTGKTEANGEESNNFNHVEQDLEQE